MQQLIPHINAAIQKIIFFILFTVLFLKVNAQVSNPHIDLLRYNDDFSYLNNNTVSKKGLEHLKMIPLFGKDTNYTVSVGLNSRQVYQYYKNESFGTVPVNLEDNNGFLWSRLLFHTDVRLGKHFRGFAQLNSALIGDRQGGPRPVIDKNSLALHQAFVDINAGDTTHHFRLRVGRQEMALINSFLITTREAPNQRQAFDAIRFTYTAKRNLQVNAFAGQALDYRFGVFDDKWQKGQYLFSLNVQYGNQKRLLGDVVYLASHNSQIFLAGISGRDNRHTIGLTLVGQKEGFNFEAATYYQLGNLSVKKISAYTSFGLIKYTLLKHKLKPYASLVASAISGDKHPLDKKVNTFNTLYSRPYYAQSNPLGRTNSNIIEFITGMLLPKNIAVKAAVKSIWRNSLNDGLYNPGGLIVYPKNDFSNTFIPERHVGISLDSEASIPIDRHTTFLLNAEFVWAGSYLKKLSNGKNILFFSATLYLAI